LRGFFPIPQNKEEESINLVEGLDLDREKGRCLIIVLDRR
jgi:hypothetical protein